MDHLVAALTEWQVVVRIGRSFASASVRFGARNRNGGNSQPA